MRVKFNEKINSTTELEQINRIRLKLQEDCKDDIFRNMVLLRFLRSRNHNEKQTYKDLVKYFQWRVDNEVDAALDEHFIAKISNELSKEKSLVVENADHHGRPVNFVFARRHHNNDRDLEEVKLSIIHVLEKLISKSNPNEEKITVAVDLTSFSLINLVRVASYRKVCVSL